MTRVRALRMCLRAPLFLVVASLMGCGVSSTEELKIWLDKEHKLLGAAATPFVATRSFEPQAYTLADSGDPFDIARLNGVEAPVVAKAQSMKKPSDSGLDFNGPKQALENFPLESVHVKGILSQDGVQVALVWAGDRLHQVRQGDSMGTHRGKVLHISPSALVVSEREQDASGQWKSKDTVLSVQEGEK